MSVCCLISIMRVVFILLRSQNQIFFILKISPFWLLFFLCVVFLNKSNAYIPSSSLIFQRIISTHGKGIYVIENEVEIPVDDQNLTYHEKWYVQSGNLMKVIVRGLKPFQGKEWTFLYRDQKKYFLNSSNVLQQKSIDYAWLESWFHFRSVEGLIAGLKNLSVLPDKYKAKSKGSFVGHNFVYLDEDNLNLTRVGGTVTYAFGIPTQPNSTKKQPGFWVEQDQFLIRKIRWPDETQVSADQYQSHSGGLWFPSHRIIESSGKIFLLRTLSVQKISDSSSSQDLFNVSHFKKYSPLPVDLPPLVQDFYSNFR